MKVSIKLIALLLYLILNTQAAPAGKGNKGGGENEGGEAGEAGEAEKTTGGGKAGENKEAGEAGKAGENKGAGKAGETGEQGEAGNVGEQGETGPQEGQVEGGEAGEQGETVQAETTVAPTNEEQEATEPVTGAMPGARSGRPTMNNMPLVTQNDFNYLDTNGDGFLDYKELFLAKNNYNPVYLNAAFQISDRNFDGVVDQPEFFRHPLSWGRVVAEKQFFDNASQPDRTPTADETYTESPAGSTPQPSEDQVNTTVPSDDQSATNETALDQQPIAPNDTSADKGIASAADKTRGDQNGVPAKETTDQTKTGGEPAGAKVGSKTGTVPVGGKAEDRQVGTGDVSNGGMGGAMAGSTENQTGMVPKETVGGKPGAGPGCAGGNAQGGKGCQAGQAGSMGGPGATESGKMGGCAGGNAHGGKGCQAGQAGSMGGPGAADSGKMGGQQTKAGWQHGQHKAGVFHGGHYKGQQKMAQTGTTAESAEQSAGTSASFGSQARSMGGKGKDKSGRSETDAATRQTGSQAGISGYPAKASSGHIGVSGHSQTPSGKKQVTQQHSVGNGQRWGKSDAEQGVNRETAVVSGGKSKDIGYNGPAKSGGITDKLKYLSKQQKQETEAGEQSEEEEGGETSSEAEDKKQNKKNSDNDSEDTDDKDDDDDK